MRVTALICILALYFCRPEWLQLAQISQSDLPYFETFVWEKLAPGFEVVDASVYFHGQEVEIFHMSRIDPRKFRFEVRVDPELQPDIESWQRKLAAPFVINGSYYLENANPQTPTRSQGVSYGPERYISNHGGLILDDTPRLLEFSGADAGHSLAGFQNAFVSYPLLLDSRGKVRAGGHDDWLANRSFVALERSGKLLFVTTKNAFFSLRRLGEFLKVSGLNLQGALNLDGGPVACQVVRLAGFRRTIYGRWELRSNADRPTILHQRIVGQRWPLPIVIAAFPLSETR